MAVKRKKTGRKVSKARRPTKKAKRTPAAGKKAKRAVRRRKKTEEGLVGVVTHYFPHVNAAVLKLTTPLSVGETIRIKGHTTDFTQTVESIQINHVPYTTAKKGDEIGLEVKERVRRKDKAYKV